MPDESPEFHVSADYCSSGVERRVRGDAGHRLEVVTPAELGVTPELAERFRAWQQWFEAVWVLSGLEGRVEMLGDAFDEVGRGLAKQLADELGPGVKVVYRPQGGWCRVLGHGACVVIGG